MHRRPKNAHAGARNAAIGTTAGFAVGAAAGALPFLLRHHGAANGADGADESAEE